MQRAFAASIATACCALLPLYFSAVLLFGTFVAPAMFVPRNLWQLAQLLLFDFRGDTPITDSSGRSGRCVPRCSSTCWRHSSLPVCLHCIAGLRAGSGGVSQRCTRRLLIVRLLGTLLPSFPQTAAYAGSERAAIPISGISNAAAEPGRVSGRHEPELSCRGFARRRASCDQGPGLLAVGALTYLVSALLASRLESPHLGILRLWAVGTTALIGRRRDLYCSGGTDAPGSPCSGMRLAYGFAAWSGPASLRTLCTSFTRECSCHCELCCHQRSWTAGRSGALWLLALA